MKSSLRLLREGLDTSSFSADLRQQQQQQQRQQQRQQQVCW
jgi:hypothetical protein